MALKSTTLAGSARLEQAAAGGPSVKKGPPHDVADAVGRIQRALVQLGYPMPKSFPGYPAGEPDGIFGAETHATVLAFQKQAFAKEYSQWDGRVGRNTLARMDERLSSAGPEERTIRQPMAVTTTSRCATLTVPGGGLPGLRRGRS
ncbi:peptidoglycan-binding protein [Luteimonas sp. SJ-92]|uniref:Peptidoglycan-binding protein n=1 Tax=Luteimonas salinisoli TaxID=2752307 RepID=A0A853JGP7_9GAMM|nr:peptidoglycan-binding domain-containing protein [Luteimonas salinisoli]NZA28593.1 peptidoglycan-binding protein [Luteimonas salinisoli]